MSDPKTESPPLGENDHDRLVALTKGAVGFVPFVGSLLAEVISFVVPNQRFERLEEYVRRLNERLSPIEASELRARLASPDAIDLFETGGNQAARALSSDRRERIAEVVANGIKGSEAERLESKRLLALMNEIDDDQMIVLASYSYTYSRDDDFYERHSVVLTSPRAHFGSPQDELDRAVMYQLNRQHLARLGVLKSRIQRPATGKPLEIDPDTGMAKSSGYELTPLGRILLRRIGLLEPNEL